MAKRKAVLSVLYVSMLAAQASAQGSVGFASMNGGTTGGEGGAVVRASTGTEIHAALCGRASSSTPIIIEVEGVINHGNTSKVSGSSCNTADDKIEIKEVSNITLIGVGGGALFDELGIHVRSANNIVIRNVHVRNVKKSGSPTSNGGDAIGMESDVSNVWVDHVTLEASGGEDEGYDALFDMKNNTKYVTLSYSVLKNSGRGGLVGSSDSDRDNGPVTFHHNWYENINSRTPLLRAATAHAFNNYYSNIGSSGINTRLGADIRVENNYFENSANPLGTFYTNELGDYEVSGNYWGSGITWSSAGDKSYPAGPNPSSTTTVPVAYEYWLDDAGCVKDLVRNIAGANKGLLVSDGSCQADGSGGSGSDDSGSGGSGSDGAGSGSGGSGSDGSGSSSGDLGANLSLGAGSDGSSKGSGTSYGNVRDGNTDSFWSPNGSTGRISIKWSSDQQLATVVIREAAGSEGVITGWRLVDHDTGEVIATGSNAGRIDFSSRSVRKISFEITNANGTPRIGEFETYGG